MNIKDQSNLKGAEHFLFNQYLEKAGEGFSEANIGRPEVEIVLLDAGCDPSPWMIYILDQ